MLENYECGGFIFNSKFDSGNLDRVEFIKKNEDSTKLDTTISKEFNLYTKPDCGGTVYENGNRTWFYFGVKGGEFPQLVKFNLMNLNRQAKLYSQGMHPVTKTGVHGKWDRIKDKPTYYMENENFILSFIHRVPENCDEIIFYAFTYPYTCSDLDHYLDKLDKKHELKLENIESIIKFLNSQSGADENVEKMKNFKISVINENNTEGTCSYLSNHEINNNGNINEVMNTEQSILDDKSVFIEPINEIVENYKNDSESSYLSQIQTTSSSSFTLTDEIPTKSDESPNSSNSIEIDSIQSLPKIEDKEEFIFQKLSNCFAREKKHNFNNDIYYYRELLVHSLQGRRVELITITSFAGITNEHEPRLVNLFPDKNKKRCHIFRNKKVIFLSSRVHPGETPASFVLNGFINFILDRKSIVASTLRNMYVFKIIPFLNPDGVYNGMYRSDTLGQNLNRVYLSPKLETHPTIYAAKKIVSFYHYGCEKNESNEPTEEYNENILTIKENVINSIKTSAIIPMKSNSDDLTENLIKESTQSTSSFEICLNKDCEKSNEGENSNEFKFIAQPTSSLCLQTTSKNLNLTVKKKLISKQNKNQSTNHSQVALKPSTSNKLNTVTNKNLNKEVTTSSSIELNRVNKINVKKNLPKKELKLNRPRSPMHTILGQSQRGNNRNQSNKNLNLNLKCSDQLDEKLNDEKSNLFLYIDLHGHASKKGVFMYGNHLPNVAEAVECMLLPRLMSMNCHHFHFDSCNFSERNMYLKGKRDGLSKEGSGRVAIYKAIGLVKSYTLESNYNTGKIVNVLPPKGKETSVKMINLVPPKYTPAIFEEVGRALGPSILDLTNSNPISRLGNSEFRTLQGLRNALKLEIDKNSARNLLASKISRVKIRRLKNSCSRTSSTQVDALKENKGLFYSWDIVPSGSNLSNSNNGNNVNFVSLSSQQTTTISTSTTSRPMSSTAIQSTSSTTSTKLMQTSKLTKKSLMKNQTIFGKKENMNSKKIKIFCDSSSSITTQSSSSNTIVTKNSQTIKVITDLQQIQQIPRKRIKVSSNQIQLSNNKFSIDNESSTPRDLLNYGSTTSLKNFYDPVVVTNSLDRFDQTTNQKLQSSHESPCCSNSLKSYNPLKSSTSSSSSPSNTSATTTFLKNLTKTNKNKLRKSNSLPNLSKKISSDSTKMKKKRVIKSETGLKRKKSRVKQMWH